MSSGGMPATFTTLTTSHQLSSSTEKPNKCDPHGGYIYLNNTGAELCVHIVLTHKRWDDARSKCKEEGGDLVILDTHEKALLLRYLLAHHSSKYSKDINTCSNALITHMC